jgi:hypothetical protein
VSWKKKEQETLSSTSDVNFSNSLLGLRELVCSSQQGSGRDFWGYLANLFLNGVPGPQWPKEIPGIPSI